VFYALAEHDAMCFAPFGIDSLGEPDPAILNVAPGNAASQNATADATLLAASFRLLHDMMPVIAAHQGTGRMRGVLQRSDLPEELVLGGYRLRVRYNTGLRAGITPAAGLIIAEGPDEFLVAGHGFGVDFLPREAGRGQVEFWRSKRAIFGGAGGFPAGGSMGMNTRCGWNARRARGESRCFLLAKARSGDESVDRSEGGQVAGGPAVAGGLQFQPEHGDQPAGDVAGGDV
jgi:hypothetical protein